MQMLLCYDDNSGGDDATGTRHCRYGCHRFRSRLQTAKAFLCITFVLFTHIQSLAYTHVPKPIRLKTQKI